MNHRFQTFQGYADVYGESTQQATRSDGPQMLSVSRRGSQYGYLADDEGLVRLGSSSSSRSQPYLVVSSGTSAGKRGIVYPWGVNPVNSQLSSERKFQGSEQSRTRHISSNSSMYGDLLSENQQPNDDGPAIAVHSKDEYVDTSSISTGLEPLLELLHSFFNFISGRDPKGPPSSSDSESDIEVGLRTPSASVIDPSSTVQATMSGFDMLHSSPVRFPSSINELLGSESPRTPWKKYPIPDEDPPSVPPLPVPKLRNDA
jgi:hypothetical protein